MNSSMRILSSTVLKSSTVLSLLRVSVISTILMVPPSRCWSLGKSMLEDSLKSANSPILVSKESLGRMERSSCRQILGWRPS